MHDVDTAPRPNLELEQPVAGTTKVASLFPMLPLFDELNDLSAYDHFMQGSITRRVWARSRRRAMNPQYWYMYVLPFMIRTRIMWSVVFSSRSRTDCARACRANVDTKELSYENFGVLGDWFYNKHVELFRSIYLPCLPRYAS